MEDERTLKGEYSERDDSYCSLEDLKKAEGQRRGIREKLGFRVVI